GCGPRRVEGFEVVLSQVYRIDQMCFEETIHLLPTDLCDHFQLVQVFIGCVSTDSSVGLDRQRCVVDDTVVPLPFHPLCHAPLLGEDMMDIDRVIEVSALLDLLTGTQIGHIMLEEKGVEALVSSTVASTQGVQPPRGELCLLHRSWLGAAPLRPG